MQRRSEHEGRAEVNRDIGPPMVSVIITCYNQGHFLAEAIESVLNQSYPHVEVVVVDDGSSDCTSEVAGRCSSIRYVKQENKGLAAARNTGIRHSRGSYLVFLDSDDRLLPTAIDAGLNCFTAHPECGFVFGSHILVSHDGLPLGKPTIDPVDQDHYFAMLHKNYIKMHATVMYRRNILLSVNGFDTSLVACEDYDLYLRIARRYSVHSHGQVVAEYRMHDTRMSHNAAMMLKTALTALGAQWPYVKADRRYRNAYKAGARFWKHYYGKKLLKQVVHMGTCGHALQAVKGAAVLLRYVGVVTTLRYALIWLVQSMPSVSSAPKLPATPRGPDS